MIILYILSAIIILPLFYISYGITFFMSFVFALPPNMRVLPKGLRKHLVLNWSRYYSSTKLDVQFILQDIKTNEWKPFIQNYITFLRLFKGEIQ